jgi:hypothetical protein
MPNSHSRQLPLLPIVPITVQGSPLGLGSLAIGTLCLLMQAADADGASTKSATITASTAVCPLRIGRILPSTSTLRSVVVSFQNQINPYRVSARGRGGAAMKKGKGITSARPALTMAAVALVCCLAPAYANGSGSAPNEYEGQTKVRTDGRLRSGRFETIRVKGFPGEGRTEVTFLPTAICESSCGATPRPGAKTNASGAATFRVRVPGTFFNSKNKRAYFRNGERIDLEVLWEGSGHTFDVGSADPDPILIRTHKHRSG